jgi:hypothetical protein
MDELIRRKGTGTPDEFAAKLGISKSMLMINLNEFKELGGLVKFDSSRGTYFYEQGCSLKFGFEKESGANLKGGNSFFINSSITIALEYRILLLCYRNFEQNHGGVSI